MVLRKTTKILLVHTGGIGDLIMARPAIQIAHRKYQPAHIDFLGNSGSSKILMQDTCIHKFIPVPSKQKNMLNIMQILITLLKTRFEKYDRLFLLQPVLTEDSHQRLKFFVKLISAKKTIGRRSNFGNNFLDVVIPEDTNLHEVERMLSVVSENRKEKGDSFEYHLPETLAKKLDLHADILNKDFVVLSPGGTKIFRRWPITNFLELARRFNRQGIEVIFIGDKKEKKILKGREGQLPEGTLNLIGETSLEQLISLIRKAKIVVANDSGPMHLANTLDVPVIGIFGSGDTVRTRPYFYEKARVVESPPMDCKPCYAQKCDSLRCMDEITVDRVWKAVLDLI